MNDECVVQLHIGDWPLLTTLDLSYNDIGADGAGHAVANWMSGAPVSVWGQARMLWVHFRKAYSDAHSHCTKIQSLLTYVNQGTDKFTVSASRAHYLSVML